MIITCSFTSRAANAANSYAIYGHPSPLTFFHAAHAALQRSGCPSNGRVLAVLHDCTMRGIMTWSDTQSFNQIRSAARSGEGIKTPPDIPRMDLVATMAFEVNATDEPSFERLTEELENTRFGGGVVLGATVRRHQRWSDAARAIPRGAVITAHRVAEDHAGSIAGYVAAATARDGSWVSPSLIGYRLLEEPAAKEGARAAEHAYADPLMGLVRLVHLSRVKNELKDHLWHCVWENNCYIATTI